MPATAPSLLHDFQKLDLEDERRAGLDRGRPALIAVRQVGGAHEPTLAADLHHRQALAPALDDAAQAERQRFAALDGAVEHRAVDELPLVVDLHLVGRRRRGAVARFQRRDRKSTRLNSSHGYISYAVFCLKKKKKQNYK